jgi:integrase
MLKQFVLKRLGPIAVADVTPWHIEKLVNEIGRVHPYRANRVRALLSTMFNRAVRIRQWCAANPVLGVRRFPEQKRKRYLSDEELPALMEALDALRNQRIADAIRLLLFTGARRSEVLTATWSEFDLKHGVWVKPSHHTKQKEDHRIPLNAAALELVRNLYTRRREGEAYLFPGAEYGEPFKDVKKSWRQVVTRAGLENFRLHDLRHSFASILLNRSIPLEVVGGLLGHTQIATTQRYAHLVDKTMREATEKLTQALPAPPTAK